MNLAFAVCGIVGAKNGIGRKLLYFEAYPEHFSRALLVRFHFIAKWFKYRF